MEFLNNIWNLLITESAFVTNVVTAPLTFVEAYFSFKTFTLVFNIEYTKSNVIIHILVMGILGILNSFFIPYPFSTYLTYIVLFILIKCLLKTSFVKTILCLIIPIIVFGLVNSLIMNPFLKLFNTSFDIVSVTPIYQFLYLIVVYLIVGFLLLIFRHKNNIITNIFHTPLDPATKSVILFNLIFGFVTLCIQSLLTVYYVSVLPVAITLFNFMILFAYFAASFYSLNKLIKLNNTTLKLENAESYNKTLTILYDNVRVFKHDFDNMVNFIGGCIKANDMDGLKKYYDSLEKDYARVNNIQLLNPNIINNSGVYNLIVSKHQKATDLDVKINLEIFFDFNELHMPIYSFSKILGILLDNAIESAKDSEGKEVNLMFRASRKNHVEIVSIENTYSDKDVDTRKIFEKGISGKKNHSGIGLWEVNKIISKNNNVVLHTSKDDKFFKQKLEIYY